MTKPIAVLLSEYAWVKWKLGLFVLLAVALAGCEPKPDPVIMGCVPAATMYKGEARDVRWRKGICRRMVLQCYRDDGTIFWHVSK